MPFVYFNLPSLADEQEYTTIDRFNKLFQDFLRTLDTRNNHPHADYVRKFDEEGGVAYVYFPDGFIHHHSKMFYYHHPLDRNISEYSGVTIRNHTDQQSYTYGVMRIAQAFAKYLKSRDIPFKIFLRKMCDYQDVEINPTSIP